MYNDNYQQNFWDWCEYYYGTSSDVTGELPLMWYDRYCPIEDEL